MFEQRSNKLELMDNLALSDQALAKNLQELKVLNYWLGSKTVLISSLNNIYKKHSAYIHNTQLKIADLGCGGGDLLIAIHQWAKAKKLQVDVVGIDANPFMINFAKQKTRTYENIRYQIANIFSPKFLQFKYDIIVLNTCCHHFTDKELIILFKRLAQQTSLAVVVNDLHRNWFSYYAIKYIAKIFNFSYLAQHDAPLSVLRAFRKQELIQLLKLSGLRSFNIKWKWAFRWQVIIWMTSVIPAKAGIQKYI